MAVTDTVLEVQDGVIDINILLKHIDKKLEEDAALPQNKKEE